MSVCIHSYLETTESQLI